MCIAYHSKAWRRIGVLYLISSFCMFLTMVFFASGVCSNGCTIEKAGGFAIAAGFMWLLAGGLSYRSAPMDRSKPKSSCCCCPMPIEPVQSAYRAISIQDEGVRPEEAHEEKALIASDVDDGDAVEKTAVTSGDAGEK